MSHMDGIANIDDITKKFCQSVMEKTMEGLRGNFANNGEIGDDQLDRLKSLWEQRWTKNLRSEEEKAK